MKNRLVSAAVEALSRNLGLQTGDRALLVFDDSTTNIAEALGAAAVKLGIEIEARQIEPTGGHGRDPDPETMSSMLRHKVVICPTRYSLTHCAAATAAREAGARIATLPGIDNNLFATGLLIDPVELRRVGQQWIDRLSSASRIRVVSPGGTDIEFGVSTYSWKNDDALIVEPGTGGNLPGGEVFIAPDKNSGEGVIVFDGSIGSMDWERDKSPARITVRDGRAIEFEGARGLELREILAGGGGKGFLLAEFGIGTNPELEISGNLLGDEKVRGTIHLAFGNNRGFGGDNDAPVHIDGLVLNPEIIADGERISAQQFSVCSPNALNDDGCPVPGGPCGS